MAVDDNPRHTGDATELVLQLDSATQPVSLMSSLLRTVQAAVREALVTVPSGAERFAEAPHPVLLTSIAESGAGGGLELRFFFADPESSKPEPEVSRTAFGAFMDRLEEALKAQPQRMLWDSPARPPRGPAESDGPSARIRQLWDDLGRLPSIALAVGPRRVTVTRGSVEITGS
jgi:hypothetical protein